MKNCGNSPKANASNNNGFWTLRPQPFGASIDASESPAALSNVFLAMEAHAKTNPRGEVCGFVYKDQYVRLENISGSNHRFYASPMALAKALADYGEPDAIFHTHPNLNLGLSREDRKMWYYIRSTIIVGCMHQGRLQWKMYGKRSD